METRKIPVIWTMTAMGAEMYHKPIEAFPAMRYEKVRFWGKKSCTSVKNEGRNYLWREQEPVSTCM